MKNKAAIALRFVLCVISISQQSQLKSSLKIRDYQQDKNSKIGDKLMSELENAKTNMLFIYNL